MTILLSTNGSPVELRLDSSSSTHIPNTQGGELTLLDRMHGAKVEERFIGAAIPVSEPQARYNCHGMVFASRRTMISEAETVSRVLKEDGYVEVSEEKSLPGDIVVYLSESGDPEHSGLVVEASAPSTFNMPRILSKWGRWREFVHMASVCPYEGRRRYFRIT